VPFARVYAGATHTCGLTLANSTVRCWGNSASLGDENLPSNVGVGLGASLANPFPDGACGTLALAFRVREMMHSAVHHCVVGRGGLSADAEEASAPGEFWF
jgi:hypothetical protein